MEIAVYADACAGAVHVWLVLATIVSCSAGGAKVDDIQTLANRSASQPVSYLKKLHR